MKKILLATFILLSTNIYAENTVPVGDAAQATVRTFTSNVGQDGTGNVDVVCPYANTSCEGLDCESCGGCLTPENSKQISESQKRDQ